MKTFHLTIAKVGENLFDGEASSVIVPGSEGTFTILAEHEPLVSNLRAGELRVHASDGSRLNFPAETGGIAEVSNNQATILL